MLEDIETEPVQDAVTTLRERSREATRPTRFTARPLSDSKHDGGLAMATCGKPQGPPGMEGPGDSPVDQRGQQCCAWKESHRRNVRSHDKDPSIDDDDMCSSTVFKDDLSRLSSRSGSAAKGEEGHEPWQNVRHTSGESKAHRWVA